MRIHTAGPEAGRRIREVRRAIDMTSAEVARRADCSANGLRQLESGARAYVSDAYLERIGVVLGVTVPQLRGHDPLPSGETLLFEHAFAAGYEQALADATLESLALHTRGQNESQDSANASLQAVAA
ncbi:MAG TPA: helix-turn-helix transcriptional regulator [Phycisphaerales bacterium]|nr:helix-turn-helix transcriptional regulator [Phycisphaerales bacterium]